MRGGRGESAELYFYLYCRSKISKFGKVVGGNRHSTSKLYIYGRNESKSPNKKAKRGVGGVSMIPIRFTPYSPCSREGGFRYYFAVDGEGGGEGSPSILSDSPKTRMSVVRTAVLWSCGSLISPLLMSVVTFSPSLLAPFLFLGPAAAA